MGGFGGVVGFSLKIMQSVERDRLGVFFFCRTKKETYFLPPIYLCDFRLIRKVNAKTRKTSASEVFPRGIPPREKASAILTMVGGAGWQLIFPCSAEVSVQITDGKFLLIVINYGALGRIFHLGWEAGRGEREGASLGV